MQPKKEAASRLFAGYRLDPVRETLFDPAGAEIRLRPKPFALLRHLLDHPGRLLGRDELLDALWPGVAVTDDSLTQCVSDLRRAFGDAAAGILRTVPRRGYMLTAAVQRDATGPEAAPASSPVHDAAPRLAEYRRDTLVVRPAAHAGGQATGQPGSTFWSDLIVELIRFEDLRVVTGSDDSLGTGFVLHTELHASMETMRAFLRLEDIVTGTVFWADRAEWPAGASGAPTAATTAIAGAIDLEIARKSLRRAQQSPPDRLSARECSLIGRDLHQRGTEADTIAARAMFLRATALDPGFAAPHAWAAFTMMRVVTFDWNAAEHGGGAAEAVRLARQAVKLDPESALCQSALAFALALVGHWDEAVEIARLALRFSRIADYGTRSACGEVLTAAGHPEETVAALRETLALDPRCPPRTRAVLGRALLLANHVEEALRELRGCAAYLPDYAPCARTMVVAAIEAGMIEEARSALRTVRELRPQWLPGDRPIFWFLRRAEDIERFHDAFQVALRLDATAAAGLLLEASPRPS
jgi:DNA-binding winged helix-turn-helix (wHTH) protein/tetratricopeptide (TPR) repeat protein